MYNLENVLNVDVASSVPPGSSILVSGPAMTGKDDLTLDLLADGAQDGEGAVVITTGDRAADVIGDLESRAPEAEAHQFATVDCRAEGSRTDDELDSGAYVYRVGSPSDLTGMGIGITQSFERLRDAGHDRTRLALSSLSTMLTYSDRQTIFKFCHVLSSRLDSTGYLGFFTVDSSAHDDQTLQVLKQAFDGLVEIREVEGSRQARVRGLRPDPSDWADL